MHSVNDHDFPYGKTPRDEGDRDHVRSPENRFMQGAFFGICGPGLENSDSNPQVIAN